MNVISLKVTLIISLIYYIQKYDYVNLLIKYIEYRNLNLIINL